MTARWFVGVDVGGTFTDVVLASSHGELVATKVATTPADPRDGVALGVSEVLGRAGVEASTVTRVVHGTTLATNVIVERRGQPVAFVTTEGFGDLLRLGREVRGEDERFDLSFAVPVPPVPRERTFEVTERCRADGQVVVPIDQAQVDEVVAKIVAAAPASVAICFLHAYANPRHERLVAAACRAALGPSVLVMASSEVWPEVREYERAMTTVMCAYVGPVMSAYLWGLVERLGQLGIDCPVQVMESGGGVMSAALAAERPVFTVESGGAAGVMAAGFVGSLLGAERVISFDMGGTTAKAGIVRHGRPGITHDFHVGDAGSHGGSRSPGFPIKVPVVDLAEVGAGGGSIAWLDTGGALRVGPASAGSDPGPACYGGGGVEPTVTDANLVLGYLRPGELSGGIVLSPELARDAIARLAEPLGMAVEEAAHAIHEIVNANMAAAIRLVTVQRGIDPRDFTMVGFGGAGPMHLARLAAVFGIRTVAVPWAAGVASAVGLVTSDLSVDSVRTRLVGEHELTPAVVNTIFDELAAAGIAALPAADDRDGGLELLRSVDVRFRGQAHQLTVPVPSGVLAADDVARVVKAFGELYEHTYGIAGDGPVEFVSFRTRVVRVVEKHRPQPLPVQPGDAARAVIGERQAHFSEVGGFVATPVLDRDRLVAGDEMSGPAIVEGADSTIVVPPWHRASVDRWRNLLLHREPVPSGQDGGARA